MLKIFFGDVVSSQSFKPDLIFESEPIAENKLLKGKIKMFLPNKNGFTIYKSYLEFNQEDKEIYVIVQGFKNIFKLEATEGINEDYIQELNTIPSLDHTTFGPFDIKENLSTLAKNTKYELKDAKSQTRNLVGANILVGADILNQNVGIFTEDGGFEIDFKYKIINNKKKQI